MKSFLSFIFLLFFIINISSAQDNTTAATFSPEHIKVGDKITVTYNPATANAVLKDAKTLTALALLYRGEDDPLLMESPMSQSGTGWTATFTIPDKNAKHVVFQFVSGEIYDDNNKTCWPHLVYGSDDKPVQGAHYSLADVLNNGGQYFGENKDPDAAKQELAKELELYPDNPDAQILNIQLGAGEQKSPEAIEQAHKTLAALSEKFKNDEKKLYPLTFLYSMLGDAQTTKQLTDSAIARNPKGYFAQQRFLRPFYSERDINKASALISALLDSFPDIDQKQKQSFTENIAFRLTNEKKYDLAEQWLQKSPKPSSVYYNYLARNLADDSVSLEKAVTFAKRAVELNRQINPADKPSYERQTDWDSDNKTKLAASLGTTGYALMKMGNFTDAEPLLREAYETNDAASPDINQRYVYTLNMNKHFDQAITVGLNCVKKLQDNARLLDDLKNSYIGKDGSDKNYSEVTATKRQSFADAVEKAAKEHRAEIDKKIANERTTKPAPDFTLNDMSGNPVSLSSLKGKVVIVDFWATWCGPCKQSFPFMQYVYENYQSNDNVKFLMVNTWERIKGDSAILANTKKFITTNKYTFPVLMDKDAVSNYSVEGIPTKFIIDKKGNIAYTSIGYDGPQMVDELTKEIEMLLKE